MTRRRTRRAALVGADMLLGLSRAGLVTAEMLVPMAPKPIIFVLANPDPEIDHPTATATRPDAIGATGRSDYNNQVNNVLGFPFIFRGTLDVWATQINEAMKVAAAHALAELARKDVPQVVNAAYGEEFRFGPEYIIPKPFNPRVLTWVAPARMLRSLRFHQSGAVASGSNTPVTGWSRFSKNNARTSPTRCVSGFRAARRRTGSSPTRATCSPLDDFVGSVTPLVADRITLTDGLPDLLAAGLRVPVLVKCEHLNPGGGVAGIALAGGDTWTERWGG